LSPHGDRYEDEREYDVGHGERRRSGRAPALTEEALAARLAESGGDRHRRGYREEAWEGDIALV